MDGVPEGGEHQQRQQYPENERPHASLHDVVLERLGLVGDDDAGFVVAEGLRPRQVTDRSRSSSGDGRTFADRYSAGHRIVREVLRSRYSPATASPARMLVSLTAAKFVHRNS
ncbi:hypothetical protein ACFQER_08250 [Halomicroarcula sp. GCM10025894]|uniref:hypothetical protein n=1 Tax=Halomicroarcula sp. GCM10025894 TaxID=3252673 RepID=UPI003613EF99